MSLILKENYQLAVQENLAYIRSEKYDIPINPRIAIFFTILNGTREVSEIQDILVQVGLCSHEYAPKFCNYVVNRFSTILIEDDLTVDNPNRAYNPKDFAGILSHKDEKMSMKYPDAILWNVTNNCDKACIYCYMNASPKSIEPNAMTFHEITRVLDEAAAMAVSHIAMTGGEPFIRKDLTKVINYAHKLGMSIAVTTKFNLSPWRMDELANLHKLHLYISYDCHIDEIASHLTGTKNQASKMQKMIKGLIERNIPFSVTPVVTGINVQHFFDFIVHLESLGVKDVSVSRYVYTFGRNMPDLLVTDQKWNEIVEYIHQPHKMKMSINMYAEDYVEQYGTLDEHSVCVNGRYSIPLTYDGKAILCEQIPEPTKYCFGDIQKQTLEQIWNSPERHNLIFPPRQYYKGTGCYNCTEFDTCMIKRSCAKRSLKQAGTLFAPDVLVQTTCPHYK